MAMVLVSLISVPQSTQVGMRVLVTISRIMSNVSITWGGQMQNAESGVILPSQYFGGMFDGALCSEQRLMLAVLADAINILQDKDSMATADEKLSPKQQSGSS